MAVPDIVLLVVLLAVAAPVLYLYILAAAAMRSGSAINGRSEQYRFAIAIPAHNEAGVIGRTVAHLKQLDYPANMFDVHVVADHCSDRTAGVAQTAGAVVHERQIGPRGSKGAALQWLFDRILPAESDVEPYDAVVVFDADTQVAPNFLHLMAERLGRGEAIIQGQHRIRNPEDGWFPALVWAMFIVDNRLQNLGRGALGLSAKNMGDSICFRADLLHRLGWGDGLTEDYAFRQRLLLEGLKIAYEPRAIGYGEAPLSWQAATAQRARWLRGTRDASKRYARELLVQGLRRRNLALLDGALQARLPSYSTLTLLATAGLLITLTLGAIGALDGTGVPITTGLWAALVLSLVFYPLVGLALERAPLRAYAAILLGPVFIVWRTRLAVTARLRHEVTWIRTPRKVESGVAGEHVEELVHG
jgi:cellulose synthase/poly-beta-1,6-N-acetylglucosamine synthase-like glycosyltransferase